MTKSQLKQIVSENEARKERLQGVYDPLTGEGCYGERVKVRRRKGIIKEPALVPKALLGDPGYKKLKTEADWLRLRCRYDFEFWAARCVKIRAKTSGRLIPFVLNAPQRRVLGILEEDRMNGRPIRAIMLKSRQWGGSTLVQIYMSWIQLCIDSTRNSLICAHTKDTSTVIRGMYTTLLSHYPRELCPDGEEPQFKPFEGSSNIRYIKGFGSRVTIGSSERQDSVRGSDFAMAHLSEVAYWRNTKGIKPQMLISSVCGAINAEPLTLIVMESTANGPGNFFHSEWLKAEKGLSDKRAIFVPWHEIEHYQRKVSNPGKLWKELDAYEHGLWRSGLTLEQIAWYHEKRKEMGTMRQMQSEYPGTATEAFAATDRSVFSTEAVEKMRKHCRAPISCGEIEGEDTTGPGAMKHVTFYEGAMPQGLKIWSFPDRSTALGAERYIVSVDVGGRSSDSDWSVIAVIDRWGGKDGKTPEVVAQWRGHTDHDRLAWKSVAIAQYYREAHIVFESNTFEKTGVEGDPSLYILSEIQRIYPYLYHRKSESGMSTKIGFHVNRATKTAIISRLIAAVRDQKYIERDWEALDEFLTYEVKPNGSYGARDGSHDDMLMTRAIALQVSTTMLSKEQILPDDDPYFSRFRRARRYRMY